LGTRAELLRNTGLDGTGIADRVCEAVSPYGSFEGGELLALASSTIRKK